MTAYTHTCGAVDPLTGAVCSAQPRHGGRHMDRRDPGCLIQWPSGDEPVRWPERAREPGCWADGNARDERDRLLECDRRPPVAGGLCATHAERYGVRPRVGLLMGYRCTKCGYGSDDLWVMYRHRCIRRPDPLLPLEHEVQRRVQRA